MSSTSSPRALWEPHERIAWSHIVRLAQQIESEYVTMGVIDTAAPVRLARAIVQFQQQLVGDLLRSGRRV
ncbi:MAG: hypothetical protein ABSC94_26060 [Polyangiaceae bacterium]|jgi:hypothetical protein